MYAPGERAKILSAHETAAEAIISSDVDRAEKLMREHMQEFVTAFEERFTSCASLYERQSLTLQNTVEYIRL